jgi:hypothetical protein
MEFIAIKLHKASGTTKLIPIDTPLVELLAPPYSCPSRWGFDLSYLNVFNPNQA